MAGCAFAAAFSTSHATLRHERIQRHITAPRSPLRGSQLAAAIPILNARHSLIQVGMTTGATIHTSAGLQMRVSRRHIQQVQMVAEDAQCAACCSTLAFGEQGVSLGLPSS